MKEKIIDQVYRNLPYSQRPKVESVALGNLISALNPLPPPQACDGTAGLIYDWCVIPSLSTEWRPGSTGQILSDLDLTAQKEGRWKKLNTLAHYNVSTDADLQKPVFILHQTLKIHTNASQLK